MTSMKGAIVRTFLVIFSLSACSEGVLTPPTRDPLDQPLPDDRVRVDKIVSESELIPGPGATGWIGDFKLYNSRVGFIVQGNPYPPDSRLVPGTVIDGGIAPPGGQPEGDLLFGLAPWFGESEIRAENILTLTRDGRGVVSLGGSGDSGTLRFTSEYSLAPGNDPEGAGLAIVTTITNTGASPFPFRAGDRLYTGIKLVPRLLDFPGGDKLLLAGSDDLFYLYFSSGWDGNHEEGTDGNMFLILKEGELLPGESYTFTRKLLVSRSGLTEFSLRLLDLAGIAAGSLEITNPAEEIGEPHRLEVFSDTGSLVGIFAPGDNGRITAALPEGTYHLLLISPGREEYLHPDPVTVSAGSLEAVMLSLPPPSRVRYQVWEENEDGWIVTSSSAKLTFEPTEGGDPIVQVATTGAGELFLPPGIYQASLTRGPTFSREQVGFELLPGERFELRGTLRRVYGNESYYSLDLHQYTHRSPGGSATIEEWLLNNLVEDFSLAVPTDTNSVTEPASQADGSLPETPPVSFSALELKPRTGQSLLLLPASFPNRYGWGGVPAPETTEEAFAISLGSPAPRLLGATSGFLAELIPSPESATGPVRLEFPLDFVLMTDDEDQLSRWFVLLNSGYYLTAVGGSGAGDLTAGLGYPRTLIPRDPSGFSDPGTEIIQAIETHRAVVSTGPRLRYRVNCSDYHPEPFFTDTSGDVDLELELETPIWMPITELIIFANGQPAAAVSVDFSSASPLGGYRFSQLFYFNFSPNQDTWFVAVARGTESLAPVYPGHAFVVSNPVWVDVDGLDRDEDGVLFDSPYVHPSYSGP